MLAEKIHYSRISAQPLALEPMLLASERPDCGALAIFAGAVRNHHEGAAVSHLTYTAHAALCDKIIKAIEQETREQFNVPECRIVHRTGTLGIGDIAIYAVVRAPHRAEAFAALRYAVDSTKHRAPIWKEEFYPDGTSSFVTGCCIAEGHEPPEYLKLLPKKENS